MSRALAAAAVVAWAIGAVAMPVAAWLWLRAGRRRWIVAALAGGLLAEVAWLVPVAGEGLRAVLDRGRDVGMTGWAAWAVGFGGLAALVSGLRGTQETGELDEAGRAAEIGIGLFGLGVLLRQLALIV